MLPDKAYTIFNFESCSSSNENSRFVEEGRFNIKQTVCVGFYSKPGSAELLCNTRRAGSKFAKTPTPLGQQKAVPLEAVELACLFGHTVIAELFIVMVSSYLSFSGAI